MTNPTYPEKRIHTKSFAHVEPERLHARLEYLRVHKLELLRDCEQKGGLRDLAREVVNCERELDYRGEHFHPVTDGVHLVTVPVTKINRLVRPPEGRRKRETLQ